MLDTLGLLNKHKGKGVLLDAQLLVVLLVGWVNPLRIGEFKRTSNFEVTDFEILKLLISHLGPRLVSTPHVLSQASDLTDMPGEELVKVRTVFKEMVNLIEEKYDAASVLVFNPLFEKLGLADAGIEASKTQGTLILTADLDLYLALQARGVESLNYNYIRPSGWNTA